MKAGRLFERTLSRRGFLGAAGAAGTGLLASSAFPSVTGLSPSPRVVGAAGEGEGNFNWLTCGSFPPVQSRPECNWRPFGTD